MLFLVDASGSIEDKGAGNWNRIINFINRVVAAYSLGPDKTQVGMLTFATGAQVRIYLNDIYDKQLFNITSHNPDFYGRGHTNMSVSSIVVRQHFENLLYLHKV